MRTSPYSNSPAFDAWMRRVDAELSRTIGMSSMDLPDCCYADWHQDGVTPRSAAKRAIRSAKGDDS